MPFISNKDRKMIRLVLLCSVLQIDAFLNDTKINGTREMSESERIKRIEDKYGEKIANMIRNRDYHRAGNKDRGFEIGEYIPTDFDLLETPGKRYPVSYTAVGITCMIKGKEMIYHELTIDVKPRSIDCMYFYLQPDYSAEVRFETIMTDHHRAPVKGLSPIILLPELVHPFRKYKITRRSYCFQNTSLE